MSWWVPASRNWYFLAERESKAWCSLPFPRPCPVFWASAWLPQTKEDRRGKIKKAKPAAESGRQGKAGCSSLTFAGQSENWGGGLPSLELISKAVKQSSLSPWLCSLTLSFSSPHAFLQGAKTTRSGQAGWAGRQAGMCLAIRGNRGNTRHYCYDQFKQHAGHFHGFINCQGSFVFDDP